MGKDSKIEWTHHTFNPWIGCVRVSDGCTHCYAEVYGNRFGVQWGPGGVRRRTTASYWQQPLAWNRQAERDGMRRRVFCASLADVFEEHGQLDNWRAELFDLIERCEQLDWLLLTKRPENIISMVPLAWRVMPGNVSVGTSIENQKAAEVRIPELLQVRATVRFLSCEPLLNSVSVVKWWKGIDWVIVGGESGPGARPMAAEWACSLRDECIAVGIPFFFKQWGGREKRLNGRELNGRTWDEMPFA